MSMDNQSVLRRSARLSATAPAFIPSPTKSREVVNDRCDHHREGSIHARDTPYAGLQIEQRSCTPKHQFHLDEPTMARVAHYLELFPERREKLLGFISLTAERNDPSLISDDLLVEAQNFAQWNEISREKERQFRKDRQLGKQLLRFFLSPTEMDRRDFAVPTYLSDLVGEVGYRGPYSKPPVRSVDWVETPQAVTDATKNVRRAFALDCEMVICDDEYVVAQICVVDFFSEQIAYTSYVAPPRQVTDYVTDKSGITKETLTGVNKTLLEVQNDMLTLLQDSNTVLIGHGLHNDLKVLKLSHSRIIDTALVFDHPKGHNASPFDRPSLKWCAQTWMNISMQQGAHDPAEDARACIKLIKAKIEHGPAFGRIVGARMTIPVAPRFWTLVPTWSHTPCLLSPVPLLPPRHFDRSASQGRNHLSRRKRAATEVDNSDSVSTPYHAGSIRSVRVRLEPKVAM